jgi:hypothetical protein
LSLKDRSVPIMLRKLEALNLRISHSHPKKKWIERDKALRESGYRGEKKLDMHLMYLPENDFHIINDLRLDDNPFPFQIDSLITSQCDITIIENKDHSGELYFDHSNNQLIRKYKGIEEGFEDPISQVLRHKRQLQHWLKQHNFPLIPINTIVSISNNSSIIKCPAEDKKIVHELVKRVEYVPDKILSQANSQMKKVLASSELNRLNDLLISSHHPQNENILKKYGISSADIIKGVLCSNCNNIMKKKNKSKSCYCLKCNFVSKNALEKTIEDYFLLFGNSITNNQFRDFLNISSADIARYILKSMNLPYTGSNKGRIYLPRNFKE